MSTYDLSPTSISALIEEVEEITRQNKVEKKEAIRLQLTIEEALLKYADAFGEDHRVELSKGGLFAKNRIAVHIDCDPLNPLQANDEMGIMSSLMAGMDRRPEWRFANGINVLTFPMRRQRKLNNLELIALALVAGIGLGAISRMQLFPGIDMETIVTDYVAPLANAYTGLLCVMAILMIFFTFPLSIAQTENAETFHGLTRRILIAYVTFTVLALLLVCSLCLPGLSYQLIGTEGPNAIKSGLDVLLDFIPNNIVAPFLNFNCMQVLLIGLMFGCAFVAMGEKSRPLLEAFDTCNLVAVLTNNYLTKLIPIYVGLTAFSTVVQMDMEELRSYATIAYVMLGCALILMAVPVLVIRWTLKVSPKVLCRKLLPAFLINLSSASVGASFITFFNEMNRDGGMDVGYCTVSCNLGTVLFKPIYTVFLSTSVLTLAAAYGMTVTPVWVILTLLLCVMLSMAIPNIPGGASSVILLLMSQMGFSGVAAQMVVSLDVVMQFLIVPADIFCLQCVSILLAASEKKIDLDKLRG